MENRNVSLGCGTLILIAIIVAIFANKGTDDVEREVRGLRSDVTRISAQLDRMEAKLDALGKPPATEPE